MMSELTRLRDEASRLLTVYEEYKDSDVDYMRRKAHLDLDRFLMEHHEVAALLMVQGLQDAFSQLVVASKKPAKPLPWYKRVIGGVRNGNRNTQKYRKPVRVEQ